MTGFVWRSLIVCSVLHLMMGDADNLDLSRAPAAPDTLCSLQRSACDSCFPLQLAKPVGDHRRHLTGQTHGVSAWRTQQGSAAGVAVPYGQTFMPRVQQLLQGSSSEHRLRCRHTCTQARRSTRSPCRRHSRPLASCTPVWYCCTAHNCTECAFMKSQWCCAEGISA